VSFLGFSFVQPFLPLYVRELGVTDLGEAALLSGIAFAVAPLLSGLLAPFWGSLADRHGVKLMVQRALVCFVIVNVLLSLVQSPWQLLLLRACIGLFGGFGPMTASLVTMGAPQSEVGPAIGKLQATQILANAVGPLVGGVVAELLGIRTSFLVTSGMCFLAFLAISALYREDRAEMAQRRTRPRLRFRELLALPGFLPLLLVLLLAQAVDRGFGPIIPLYIAELDPTAPVASTAGTVLSLGLFVSAIAASQVGRALRRFDPRVLLALSLLIGLVSIAPLLVVESVWQLAALRVVYGLAAGTTATLAYAAATRLIPEHSRSTAFGFLGSAVNLASAVGPVAVGALATLSLGVTFAVDTAVYALALGICLMVVTRRVQRDPAPT
jgi:MFS transporter, DHA1 family, multidrug resistance protein